MQSYGKNPKTIIMKGANIRMKKVILTVSALLASAAMVFSFAGCSKSDNKEDTSGATTTIAANAEENSSDLAANAESSTNA